MLCLLGMSSELLSVLKKILNDVNSDYVMKKALPSERVLIELRTTDSGSIYVEVSENSSRILENMCCQPDSIIIGSSEDLTKLLKRELDPINAFFTGRVKVKGNLDIAYILYERLKDYYKLRL